MTISVYNVNAYQSLQSVEAIRFRAASAAYTNKSFFRHDRATTTKLLRRYSTSAITELTALRLKAATHINELVGN